MLPVISVNKLIFFYAQGNDCMFWHTLFLNLSHRLSPIHKYKIQNIFSIQLIPFI
jgi:hypothetical protein